MNAVTTRFPMVRLLRRLGDRRCYVAEIIMQLLLIQIWLVRMGLILLGALCIGFGGCLVRTSFSAMRGHFKESDKNFDRQQAEQAFAGQGLFLGLFVFGLGFVLIWMITLI